jgi:hypothetical protein
MNIKFKKSQYVIGNQVEFLQFMRSRSPMFHLSNIFLRDLHYAALEFLKKKNVKIGYTEAEKVAREIALHFEKNNLLKKLNIQTWVLNYPEFAAKQSK